jgi:uncharacterized protein with HEPN domain
VKSDLPYPGHIADSIVAIQRYTSAERDSFMAQPIVQDTVVRNFEIIGEAAGRLSPETRDRSALPWSKIVAFRNRLIHAYGSVDLQLVWDVIENELPALKAEVYRLRTELSGPGPKPRDQK